jgi:ankyrin repeat protein
MAKRLDNGDGLKKTIEIAKNAKGMGALHFAAAHGRTDICRYLIEELGFDPDIRSDLGLFSLH